VPRGLDLCVVRVGPAEDWRLMSPPLGVPGPKEDCRRPDDVAGMVRWCGFRRRRFWGSVEGERLVTPARAGLRWEEAAEEEGRAVVRGDGCRPDAGWPARRAMALLAMVVEGPALPERGCRGVEAPVVEVERGGRRVLRLLLLRREGSCGSGWMEPSFWRSRILKSRRLICRSSRRAALSLKLIFSSWMVCAFSKFDMAMLQ